MMGHSTALVSITDRRRIKRCEKAGTCPEGVSEVPVGMGQTLGVQRGRLAEMSGRGIMVSRHFTCYLKRGTAFGHPWMRCSVFSYLDMSDKGKFEPVFASYTMQANSQKQMRSKGHWESLLKLYECLTTRLYT